MVEDLRKKFSLDAKFSCVMQETKIFHQIPPPLNINVIIILKGGGGQGKFFVTCIKQDFFVSNENFLLDSGSIKGRNSLQMRTFLVLCKKRIFFTKAPPQNQCYYILSSLQKITRFNSMVKDLRNKFSLDMNIGLLGLKFSVIITLKRGGDQ